jgi:hypothetical protein
VTVLVRSVFAKRNPRNVPLDLWDLAADVPDWGDRAFRVADEYREIFAEIVRSIGEHVYKIQSEGLLQSSLEPKQVKRLGDELATIVRETIAADYVNAVYVQTLYKPGYRSRESFGSKPRFHQYSASEIRDEYEIRADLLGQWIRARAAFEARPERRGDRALHPQYYANSASKARAGLAEMQRLVTSIQSNLASGKGHLVVQDMFDLRSAVEKLAYALGDKDLAGAVGAFRRNDVKKLQKAVAQTEKLALKGEPKPSRKLAREAAIREGDEPKQNPFVQSILGYA